MSVLEVAQGLPYFDVVSETFWTFPTGILVGLLGWLFAVGISLVSRFVRDSSD